MRKLAALLADAHSGHLLGLCNPAWRVQDLDECGNIVERAPRFTAFQEWLWTKYLENLTRLKDLAGPDPVVVLHVGDLCHGAKYPHQLNSTRQSDQIELACANLEPLLSWPQVTHLRIIEGTAAHNLGEGTAEILAARLLKARYGGLDVAVLAHSAARINGVACDVAHHGPTAGSLNWLRGDTLRRYVKSLMADAIMGHEEPPRLVIRAHFHQYVHEKVIVRPNGCEYEADAIIMPALCGLSEHGRQATRSIPRISCGMVVVEFVDGQLGQIWSLLHTADLRTVEDL